MNEPGDVVELDAEALLATLNRHQVRYLVVGGFAAVLHGADTTTSDLDATPDGSEENLRRLCAALDELDAVLMVPDKEGGSRHAVPEWVFTPESFHLMNTVTTGTRHGDLDIVLRPDAPGGRTFSYQDLAARAVAIEIAGLGEVPLASLDDVIASKEAANRAKDRAVLPMLYELRDRLRNRDVLH